MKTRLFYQQKMNQFPSSSWNDIKRNRYCIKFYVDTSRVVNIFHELCMVISSGHIIKILRNNYLSIVEHLNFGK